MRTRIFNLVTMFLLGTLSVFAGTKTDKIKVSGNCDMCKSRIEKAAKSVDGVSAADWNKKTKVLELTFDDSKTDVKKVETAIAAVGHDTELVKATDKAYNDLPSCCHYDRAGADAKTEVKSGKKMDMKMDKEPKM